MVQYFHWRGSMKSSILLAVAIIILFSIPSAPQTATIPKIKYIDYQSDNREWFVRYGQFQISFDYDINQTNGLVLVKNQAAQLAKIRKCLNIAREKDIRVLIFPELTISLNDELRKTALELMEKYARDNDAIIISGTFYDENRHGKNAVILPTGIQYTYKTRPSIFEVSPLCGQGMISADELHVFRTKYGNFLVLVCVDLISDDANYTARYLSNKGFIDVLININYNPKSQEFMREASAMTTRHPLFATITNITKYQQRCTYDGDEFGNTALFGALNNDSLREKLIKDIPDCYKTADKKKLQPAYKNLIALINPEDEALLLYDINLRVIRPPKENNAPDQGYPTVKNIEIVSLIDKVLEKSIKIKR